MKITRAFTLDEDTARMLAKQENQSALINSLLLKYFRDQEPKSMEKIDKEIAILEIQVEADKAIAEVSNHVPE